MNAIVCVDRNWGIGKNGQLLFNIPEDMQNFVLNTINKPVIMGLNTLHSLPGGKPLKNRLNIVIAPKEEKLPDDVIHVTNIKELSDYLTEHSIVDKTMVIGGGMVYNTLLPFCDYVFVTKADADGYADTFIRDLDDPNESFEVLYKTPLKNANIVTSTEKKCPIPVQYVVYKNVKIS